MALERRERGGGCSGLEPLRYFMAAFAASAQARTLLEAAVLSPTGSNSSLGFVTAADASSKGASPLAVTVADAAASLGDALVPGSMLCVLPPRNASQQKQQQQSQMRLAQLTLCVDKISLQPAACPSSWRAQAESLRGPSGASLVPIGGALPTVVSASAAAQGLSVAPGNVLASCLDDFVSSLTSSTPPPATASLPRFTVASAKRIIPGLIRSQDPVTFQPLSVWYWTPAFFSLLLLALGALAAAAALASRAGLGPALFAPRSESGVRVAHNPDVREPVTVRCEEFDLAAAAEVAPALAAVVADLPVGVGLKGGVARKLLKQRFGARPEPAGSFDVDVAVMLPDASAAAACAAKEALVGTRLGDLTLEAQDCEVDPIGEFIEYFVSRDVTLNEVLLLRVAEAGKGKNNGGGGGDSSDSGVLLFYTDAATKDAANDVVRPSVHSRAAAYTFVWDVDSRGRRYVAATPVAR